MQADNPYGRRLSRGMRRRGFLGAMSASAAVAFLAACGGGSNNSSSGSSGASSNASTAQATAQPTVAPNAKTGNASDTPKPGGVMKLTINGDPPALDPYLNLSYRVQGVASFPYSRLFMHERGPNIDPNDLRPTPDLAASKEQPDNLTFTVKLKQGVKWHNVAPLNGRAFTASDVKYSFDRFMATSPNRLSLDSVDSVTTPDNNTVTFKLKSPLAPLEFYLSSPTHLWIMPHEVIEADGDGNKRMVGTGPFILDKYEPSAQFSWKRNPDYYFKGQPYDDVQWIIIADTATTTANLRSGQLDIAGIPTSDLDSVTKANPNMVVVQYAPTTLNCLWFDISKPPFNDERVRQAASMAIDRDGLIEAAYNGKGRWQNDVPPGLKNWSLDPKSAAMGDAKKYLEHNVQGAKDLLKAAGYGNGLTTTLNGTTGYGATNNQVMELLGEMVNEAGFNASINMKEYAAHIATTFVGKFDGMAGGIGPTFFEPDDYLFSMFYSTSPRRNVLVNDPDLDRMILQQRQELDASKRKQIIYDIQKYAVTKAYQPPLAYGDAFVGVHPWLKNFFVLCTGSYDNSVAAQGWVDRS